jgi:hypothetical protein
MVSKWSRGRWHEAEEDRWGVDLVDCQGFSTKKRIQHMVEYQSGRMKNAVFSSMSLVKGLLYNEYI